MKISKEAEKYLVAIAASEPENDDVRVLKTTDAKAILNALGIPTRPTIIIQGLKDSVYLNTVLNIIPSSSKKLLDYIEYLESK